MQRVKLLPVNFGFCCRTRQMCWIVTRGCCTDSRDEAGSEWNNHRICNCPILLSSVWAAWHASHQAMLPSNFGIFWLDSFVIQKKNLKKKKERERKERQWKKRKEKGQVRQVQALICMVKLAKRITKSNQRSGRSHFHAAASKKGRKCRLCNRQRSKAHWDRCRRQGRSKETRWV